MQGSTSAPALAGRSLGTGSTATPKAGSSGQARWGTSQSSISSVQPRPEGTHVPPLRAALARVLRVEGGAAEPPDPESVVDRLMAAVKHALPHQAPPLGVASPTRRSTKGAESAPLPSPGGVSPLSPVGRGPRPDSLPRAASRKQLLSPLHRPSAPVSKALSPTASAGRLTALVDTLQQDMPRSDAKALLLHEWQAAYEAEQGAFASAALQGEVALKQVVAFTAPLGMPNDLATAMAFRVLGQLAEVGGPLARFGDMTANLRRVLLQAVYVEARGAGVEALLSRPQEGDGASSALTAEPQGSPSSAPPADFLALYRQRTYCSLHDGLKADKHALRGMVERLRDTLVQWERSRQEELRTLGRAYNVVTRWRLALTQVRQARHVAQLRAEIAARDHMLMVALTLLQPTPANVLGMFYALASPFGPPPVSKPRAGQRGEPWTWSSATEGGEEGGGGATGATPPPPRGAGGLSQAELDQMRALLAWSAQHTPWQNHLWTHVTAPGQAYLGPRGLGARLTTPSPTAPAFTAMQGTAPLGEVEAVELSQTSSGQGSCVERGGDTPWALLGYLLQEWEELLAGVYERQASALRAEAAGASGEAEADAVGADASAEVQRAVADVLAARAQAAADGTAARVQEVRHRLRERRRAVWAVQRTPHEVMLAVGSREVRRQAATGASDGEEEDEAGGGSSAQHADRLAEAATEVDPTFTPAAASGWGVRWSGLAAPTGRQLRFVSTLRAILPPVVNQALVRDLMLRPTLTNAAFATDVVQQTLTARHDINTTHLAQVFRTVFQERTAHRRDDLKNALAAAKAAAAAQPPTKSPTGLELTRRQRRQARKAIGAMGHTPKVAAQAPSALEHAEGAVRRAQAALEEDERTLLTALLHAASDPGVALPVIVPLLGSSQRASMLRMALGLDTVLLDAASVRALLARSESEQERNTARARLAMRPALASHAGGRVLGGDGATLALSPAVVVPTTFRRGLLTGRKSQAELAWAVLSPSRRGAGDHTPPPAASLLLPPAVYGDRSQSGGSRTPSGASHGKRRDKGKAPGQVPPALVARLEAALAYLPPSITDKPIEEGTGADPAASAEPGAGLVVSTAPVTSPPVSSAPDQAWRLPVHRRAPSLTQHGDALLDTMEGLFAAGAQVEAWIGTGSAGRFAWVGGLASVMQDAGGAGVAPLRVAQEVLFTADRFASGVPGSDVSATTAQGGGDAGTPSHATGQSKAAFLSALRTATPSLRPAPPLALVREYAPPEQAQWAALPSKGKGAPASPKRLTGPDLLPTADRSEVQTIADMLPALTALELVQVLTGVVRELAARRTGVLLQAPAEEVYTDVLRSVRAATGDEPASPGGLSRTPHRSVSHSSTEASGDAPATELSLFTSLQRILLLPQRQSLEDGEEAEEAGGGSSPPASPTAGPRTVHEAHSVTFVRVEELHQLHASLAAATAAAAHTARELAQAAQALAQAEERAAAAEAGLDAERADMQAQLLEAVARADAAEAAAAAAGGGVGRREGGRGRSTPHAAADAVGGSRGRGRDVPRRPSRTTSPAAARPNPAEAPKRPSHHSAGHRGAPDQPAPTLAPGHAGAPSLGVGPETAMVDISFGVAGVSARGGGTREGRGGGVPPASPLRPGSSSSGKVVPGPPPRRPPSRPRAASPPSEPVQGAVPPSATVTLSAAAQSQAQAGLPGGEGTPPGPPGMPWPEDSQATEIVAARQLAEHLAAEVERLRRENATLRRAELVPLSADPSSSDQGGTAELPQALRRAYTEDSPRHALSPRVEAQSVAPPRRGRGASSVGYEDTMQGSGGGPTQPSRSRTLGGHRGGGGAVSGAEVGGGGGGLESGTFSSALSPALRGRGGFTLSDSHTEEEVPGGDAEAGTMAVLSDGDASSDLVHHQLHQGPPRAAQRSGTVSAVEARAPMRGGGGGGGGGGGEQEEEEEVPTHHLSASTRSLSPLGQGPGDSVVKGSPVVNTGTRHARAQPGKAREGGDGGSVDPSAAFSEFEGGETPPHAGRLQRHAPPSLTGAGGVPGGDRRPPPLHTGSFVSAVEGGGGSPGESPTDGDEIRFDATPAAHGVTPGPISRTAPVRDGTVDLSGRASHIASPTRWGSTLTSHRASPKHKRAVPSQRTAQPPERPRKAASTTATEGQAAPHAGRGSPPTPATTSPSGRSGSNHGTSPAPSPAPGKGTVPPGGAAPAPQGLPRSPAQTGGQATRHRAGRAPRERQPPLRKERVIHDLQPQVRRRTELLVEESGDEDVEWDGAAGADSGNAVQASPQAVERARELLVSAGSSGGAGLSPSPARAVSLAGHRAGGGTLSGLASRSLDSHGSFHLSQGRNTPEGGGPLVAAVAGTAAPVSVEGGTRAPLLVAQQPPSTLAARRGLGPLHLPGVARGTRRRQIMYVGQRAGEAAPATPTGAAGTPLGHPAAMAAAAGSGGPLAVGGGSLGLSVAGLGGVRPSPVRGRRK